VLAPVPQLSLVNVALAVHKRANPENLSSGKLTEICHFAILVFIRAEHVLHIGEADPSFASDFVGQARHLRKAVQCLDRRSMHFGRFFVVWRFSLHLGDPGVLDLLGFAVGARGEVELVEEPFSFGFGDAGLHGVLLL
jgi:hypothetical protein